MRNLLMIIPFFPPSAGGGVFRPLGFVKHLGKFGWRPTVVTPKGGSYWIADEDLVGEVPDGCDVHRTATLSGQYLLSLLRTGGRRPRQPHVRSSKTFRLFRAIGSAVLVPDTYIGWYPFALSAGIRLLRERNFDAIYSTSPPETSHLVAAKLHEMSRLPWLADFRDPWMNLYLLSAPTPLHVRLHETLEKKVCTRAWVVVTSRWHKALLEARYPNANPVKLISNGFDREKFDALSRLRPPSEPFQILHAGMLTQKRSAVFFLRGLKLFLDRAPENRGRIRALFVGAREDESEREARRCGLGDVVEFRSSVPHSESLKLERSSHILLLIKHLSPVYQGIVPGKLYEYIGAQRPVLALAPDGEAKDLVEELRRGEVVAQDDPEGIAERVGLLYEKYRQGRLDREYDLTPAHQFDRERLAGEMARHLDSITKTRSA